MCECACVSVGVTCMCVNVCMRVLGAGSQGAKEPCNLRSLQVLLDITLLPKKLEQTSPRPRTGAPWRQAMKGEIRVKGACWAHILTGGDSGKKL